MADIKKWEVTESSYLFRHKYLTVRKDTVVTQKGTVIPDFFVIECANWVNVIAITEEGLFVMEEQYRHGLGIISFEICAGIIDEGELPIDAAKRELLEETGYGGGKWEEFMRSSPNHSSMNNTNYTFLAKGVKRISKPHQEDTEFIKVSLKTLEEVRILLENNKIIEGVMQAPLWKYLANY